MNKKIISRLLFFIHTFGRLKIIFSETKEKGKHSILIRTPHSLPFVEDSRVLVLFLSGMAVILKYMNEKHYTCGEKDCKIFRVTLKLIDFWVDLNKENGEENNKKPQVEM